MKFVTLCFILLTWTSLVVSTPSTPQARDRAPNLLRQRLERRERINNVSPPAVNRIHAMTNREPISTLQTINNAQASAAAGALKYYGGPIVAGPITMHVLTWGPVSGVNLVNQLSSFLGAIGGTPWWSILLQYGTPNQPSISNSPLTVLPPVSVANITSTTVDDSLIQSTLTSAITNGQLTVTANQQDIYVFLFPPGITVTSRGESSCQIFCAYHGTIQIGGQDLGYITFPDQGGACAGGCGGSASLFDNSCSVLSHELAETVTDLAVGLTQTIAFPLAWYSPSPNGEIGDLCNAQQATVVGTDGVTYTVQKLWSNNDAACVAAPLPPTIPPPPVTTSCLLTDSNQRALDISLLANQTLTTQAGQYLYSLIPCGTIPPGFCSEPGVTPSPSSPPFLCQNDQPVNVNYILATRTSGAQVTISANSFNVQYQSGDMCFGAPRRSSVTYTCACQSTTMSVVESPTCTYNVAYSSPTVCAILGTKC